MDAFSGRSGRHMQGRQGLSGQPEPTTANLDQEQATPLEPAQQPGYQTAGRTYQSSHGKRSANGMRGKMPVKLLALIGGVLVLAVLGWALFNGATRGAGGLVDNSKYQAVFLTNGQVYFGKLTMLGNGYYKLTNIYYLQLNNSAQKDDPNPQKTAEGSNQNSDVQLIKLGSEVHGPEDAMIIEKNQVLFFENLTKDGKVSQSIQQYNAKK